MIVMPLARRFLIAPSFARLAQKERGSTGRIMEGYFPAHPARTLLVRVKSEQCWLVLRTTDGEERTELPLSQATALLEVCAGRVAFDRVVIPMTTGPAVLGRFVAPERWDVLTVEFEERADAQSYGVPEWFGSEVTEDPGFERSAMALQEVPPIGMVPISDQGSMRCWTCWRAAGPWSGRGLALSLHLFLPLERLTEPPLDETPGDEG